VSLPLPQSVKGDSASERLRTLGLKLPVLAGNAYFVHHRTVDSSIHISGQLPFLDGELLGQGVFGRDVELETAREFARHAALNALATAVQAGGDLDRVRMVHWSWWPVNCSSRCWARTDGTPAPLAVWPGYPSTPLSRSR
jgi:hypothetical protein